MGAHWSPRMDRTAIDMVTKAILNQINSELSEAVSIATAAKICSETGSVEAAVKIAMDLEDPAYRADRLLQAMLLIRGQLLNESLPD